MSTLDQALRHIRKTVGKQPIVCIDIELCEDGSSMMAYLEAADGSVFTVIIDESDECQLSNMELILKRCADETTAKAQGKVWQLHQGNETRCYLNGKSLGLAHGC